MILCSHMRSILFLLAWWIAPPTKGYAQTSKPVAKLITRFGFVQLTGGVTVVQATVDAKQDTLNFILDTGCGGISIDSVTAMQMGFQMVQSQKTITGIAGKKQLWFSYNHTLHLPGLQIDSVHFHVNDYEILSSAYGIKIDGILGYGFLSRYLVAIDNDNMQLSVYTSGSYNYPSKGYLLKANFASIPTMAALVGDQKVAWQRFIFDTGAGMCMLFSENFVADNQLLPAKRKRFATQAEGLGGKTDMQLTYVDKVQIGKYRFKKVPVYVFNDAYGVTAYPQLGGLIGNDLLRRFNVVLNYQQQHIHLLPNSHFKDPFDYAYSGLGVYQINHLVQVMDVVPHSPAEKAGFMVGDVIVAMDNQFVNNVQPIKSALQNAGTQVRFVVQRQQQLRLLSLKVKSILH